MVQAISVTQFFGLECLDLAERNKCDLLVKSLLTNEERVSEFNNSFKSRSSSFFDCLLDFKEHLIDQKELSIEEFLIQCENVGSGKALNDYFLCALEESEQQYLTDTLKKENYESIFHEMKCNIFMNPMKLAL